MALTSGRFYGFFFFKALNDSTPVAGFVLRSLNL